MEATPEFAGMMTDAPRRRGLGTAMVALLAAGLHGTIIGALTGAGAGVWFFVIGALYGAVAGIPTGFVAGLLGAAVGGRYGYRIAGVLTGCAGGATLACAFGSGGGDAFAALSNPFGLLLIAAAAVGGLLAGAILDSMLRHPGPRERGLNRWLYETLHTSGLYAWPLWVRLLLAAGNLLALAALGAELYALTIPKR